ncbi:hypothetical protein EU522_01660 [Candidatus Thorarchaeota archaeon]|nr:MAG: hypothetical protein EU522_01660 [Candidatus Thorarchaeota archaeon]
MKKPGDLEELWKFTEADIYSTRHNRELNKTMRGDAPETLLYAVLCAIYEGHTSKDSLYSHLESMFVVRLQRMTLSPLDVDEAIQQGLNEGLVEQSDRELSLTTHGIDALKESRKQVLHEGYWMRRFLQEKNVVLISGFFLIILVILKLWVGLNIGSHAMITDGLENVTDLIVVVIIALSLRYDRDRLGAIAIMLFMLFSGTLLGYNALLHLFQPEVIEVSFWAYIVAIISIVLNLGSIWLKTLVGRMSGNLALVSDAKEDQTHIRIATGVIIGLLFAEFQIYVIDSIVAILIAIVIVFEGLEALRELLEAGDDLSVDTLHLAAADQYDDLMTAWILAQLARGPKTEDALNDAFIRGITIGYRYFDVHAVLGFSNLEEKGIRKHIQIAKRSGLITDKNGLLSITNNGLSMYYKNRVSELKSISRRFSKERSNRRRVAYIIFGWTTLILLLLFGESLYVATMTLLHSILGI